MTAAVFEEERRRVNAWAAAFASGGLDAAQQAEREELNRIRREKDEADERNFRAFEEMVRQGQQIRRQREAAESAARGAGDGTFFARPGDQYNPFSGERIIEVPEDESLRLAREARWGAGATTALNALVGNVAAPSDSDSEGSTNPASELTLTSGSEGGDNASVSSGMGPEDTSDDDDDEASGASLRTSLGEDPLSSLSSVPLLSQQQEPPPIPAPSRPDASSLPPVVPVTERWTHMVIEEEQEEVTDPQTPPPPPAPPAAHRDDASVPLGAAHGGGDQAPPLSPPAPPVAADCTDLTELD
jgi:hypothetical protein